MKAAALAKAAEQEAARVKAVEEAKVAAEAKATAEKKVKEEKIAALTPPADKADQPATVDLPRSLQVELRRVGCNIGAVDGNWNAPAQKALGLFNKHAGMKLDVKVASVDALDAVRSKPSRICPLICDHGFRADGERCVKISCGAGLFVNDNNECEKKKVAPQRPEPKQAIVRRSQEPNSRPAAAGPAPTALEKTYGCNGPHDKMSGKC